MRVWHPAWIWIVRQRRAVVTIFLTDQLVCAAIPRLTVGAANTMVRWASMESRLRWQLGRACRSLFDMRNGFSISKSWW